MAAIIREDAVWNILSITCEYFSNQSTKLVLEKMTFLGKKLKVLDVSSIDKAKKILEKNNDIAVILINLDQNKSEGYAFIAEVREKYKNHRVRIVLRTGYPTILPCLQEIESYDIDAYIPREVITKTQIEIPMVTSLRGYHQIVKVENMLSCLAGSIAHEMRNPLWQVQGNLQLISQHFTNQDDAVLDYLNDANQSVKNGLQIIDITMAILNQKPLNKEKFQALSARKTSEQAVSEYVYKEANHADKVSVIGADFVIMADPVLFKYILYNLIGNALYYVKAMPGASIGISILPDTRQIIVRDTGPGIAKEHLSKLFDSFYTYGKQGGTGLGLAYCKRTMHALGGDICCESELGTYTSFILTFPKLASTYQSIA